MAVSVYDLDRTLTRRGTWVPWLGFWLRREAPARLLLLPLLLLPALAYAMRLTTRGGLKAAAHRVVMGRRVARARVAAAAAVFAERVVAHEVFPAAMAALAADRAGGARLVLATASNAYYAEAIGSALGFDAVLATPSRWAGDALDWRLGGANNYGADKAARLTAWAATAAPAAALTFTSDHVSDLPAFEVALASGGTAVAANPSPALRALATARAWRVVDWGNVAASLFESA
ncbi:hypothetical protein IP88_12330 [alpha proteobacterium AAP81b]|nr:hypothetical protein IP88_12330 [alpha proteobacterium AAP81b]